MSRLIKDWSQSKFQPHKRLIITVRNKDVDVLNLSARALLKANGTLKGSEYCRLIAGKKESYTVGDRIIFQISNKQ
ncbi:putative conjugative transfer protein TraA [Orientia chuto str. Dubai]|uniref:Putative conjugative transfer protein TraA n=2 Tax=Candidatus Orientia mediorientalis TaxID=911112 RepID=A0A0F3MGB4_9RICK|nr:putative conjugative transfer protein TraA [Orientia chuto str. Dubai]